MVIRSVPYWRRNYVWAVCMISVYGELKNYFNERTGQFDVYVGPYFVHSLYAGG